MTDQNKPAEKATKKKRKPGGRNNAFTHGGFSQDLIWENENSEDFEELFQSVIEEFSPTGALEEDTVLTLAQSIWLKRRAERFYVREATSAQGHPGQIDARVIWTGLKPSRRRRSSFPPFPNSIGCG